MIQTVNLNSSLDYYMRLGALNKGETNRVVSNALVAGGKGINVALVAKAYGADVRAVVALGGFVGDEIVRQLEEAELRCDFVHLRNNSRINVKIKAGEETEINGRAGALTDAEVDEVASKLNVGRGDWLVLAGNAPQGTRADVYAYLAGRADGARVVVDAWGEQLALAVKTNPFLVKPNLDELCGFFGKDISVGEAPDYAERLRELGVRNVLVTLGGDGAVLAAEDGGVYTADTPRGRLVNSTGAGDSTVAGFVTAYERNGGDIMRTLAFAVASGSACAFKEALPSLADTESLVESVKIRRVK